MSHQWEVLEQMNMHDATILFDLSWFWCAWKMVRYFLVLCWGFLFFTGKGFWHAYRSLLVSETACMENVMHWCTWWGCIISTSGFHTLLVRCLNEWASQWTTFVCFALSQEEFGWATLHPMQLQSKDAYGLPKNNLAVTNQWELGCMWLTRYCSAAHNIVFKQQGICVIGQIWGSSKHSLMFSAIQDDCPYWPLS